MLGPLDDVVRPIWEPVIRYAGALILFVSVGWQRSIFLHPGLSTLLVALAAAPWLVSRWWSALPWPVWVAMVIGPVTALLWHAQTVDFAPFFLVYLAGTVATIQPRHVSLPVAALCCAPMVGYEVAGRFSGSVIWAFAMGSAWVFGSGYRWQLELLAQLRCAQADLSDRAAADERRRIAGEIHDLVAHTLAVTVLHLTGARLALQEGESAEALDALMEAEKAGREAMADIRGAVGLLGGTGGTAGALPGVGDVPRLVNSYAGAGLDVRLDYDLDGASVSGATGLAAYRIVQEALANSARHAVGQPVDVSLVCQAGDLVVAVENPLPPDWSAPVRHGMGLSGMRDRAGVAGGQAEVGAIGRRWRVAARLPLEPA